MDFRNGDRLKITINTTPVERQEIDAFFESNPALKKGETFKAWIFRGVEEARREGKAS